MGSIISWENKDGQGNNQRTPTLSESSKTQEDIAKELGMEIISIRPMVLPKKI